MSRVGRKPCDVWGEVLRKEERLLQSGQCTRASVHAYMNSEGLEAALGGGCQCDDDPMPGQAAALSEALRDATVARFVHEATARRKAREVKHARRSMAQWTLAETQGDNWPQQSGCDGTNGSPGIDRREEQLRAVRTDTRYMEKSPTYRHSGDVNWFGWPRNTLGSSGFAMAGVATATGTTPSQMPLPAAGPPLAELHAAREAARPELHRRRLAGRRSLEALSGRGVLACQRGGHS
mmetsp:Transcript_109295/g.308404  ORF Transcript_109295/g.308404 Transcript_109295/m.308404 type:complete len:236 (-) Transcript_109295:41-748(-)